MTDGEGAPDAHEPAFGQIEVDDDDIFDDLPDVVGFVPLTVEPCALYHHRLVALLAFDVERTLVRQEEVDIDVIILDSVDIARQ